MKNRWLLNLILIVIIASLGLVVVSKPGKEQEAPKTALTLLKMDDIHRIQIEHLERESIILEKQNQHWQLVKPISARANRFNVSNLLRLAETKSEASFAVSNPKELVKYGFDKPQARIKLNETELLFGNNHPLSGNRYVLFSNTAHLIPSHLVRMVDNLYTDFISGRLLEDSRQLDRIKLPNFELLKKDGEWTLKSEDKSLLATADALNDFVDEWRHASALSVDKFSGKPSLATIQLESAATPSGKQALNLEVLSYAPEFILYRVDEGLEYRFPEETGKRLLTPVPKQ
ncbi:MAG: DUF4340 domain-containing protein [Gammaproteobacteria bacterium]|nr:DUF4340 domain-containing protein [Gammaproteobacteria bacterium]